MANNNTSYSVIIQQAADAGLKGPKSVTVTAYLPGSFNFDTRAEYQAPFSQGLFGNGTLSNLAKLGGMRLTTQALTAQIWQGSTETELSLDLEFHAETDPILEVRKPILDLMKMATASIDNSTGMLKAPGPQVNIDQLGKLAGDAASQLGASASTLANALGSAAGSFFGGPSTTVQQGTLNSQDANLNGKNNTSTPTITNGGLGGSQYWKNLIRNQISIRIGKYAFFDSVVITNVQKTYEHQIDTETGLCMYAKVAMSFKPLFLIVQADLDNIFINPTGR